MLGPRVWRQARTNGALPAGVAFDAAPFALGVASGDPLADRVLLWSKLGAEGLDGSAPIGRDHEVEWIVARDPQMRDVVRRGVALARGDDGHSVHVDVDGLEPSTPYWYRFAAAGAESRVGRTRTAPVGHVDRVRVATVSCANFAAGFFAAYRHLAAETLDAVLCTGDYYYERHDSWGSPRGPMPPDEARTLEEYRRRIALYRGDPDLRAAHAAHPWILAWDDHEVVDDYAGDLAEDGDPTFAPRRAAAYRAYLEMMPVRRALAAGPRPVIQRRFAFGDLLDLFVLDTRQFRRLPRVPLVPVSGTFPCTSGADPAASMLGDAQRDWLESGLDSSRTAWRVIAQQVMMAALRIGGEPDPERGGVLPWLLGKTVDARCVNPDQWDGYAAERARLLARLERERIPDVVVLTGDTHVAMLAELRRDFDDPRSPAAAVEIVGPSIASPGLPPGTNGATRSAFYAANPHLRHVEGERRGYVVCEIGEDGMVAHLRAVDDARRPQPVAWTASSWRIDRGRAAIRRSDA